jgi:protein-L-isoaspartate(D-aspartate) O-methyltransferase
MTDFNAAARRNMVDSQVRPNKVTDPRILNAMLSVPRHEFVPANRQALAHADEDVPLGDGRVLLEPMVIARLLQAAGPVTGERALVLAAGPGYGAALLAAIGCQVTAVEDDAGLAATLRDTLTRLAPGVATARGSVAQGWAAAAPYDLILIEGAVPAIPEALGAQLVQESGRLVTILRAPDRPGYAIHAASTPHGLRARPLFDCDSPILPALRPTPAFQF